MTTKYPEVVVALEPGERRDFFAVIARVRLALRRAGVADEEITEFTATALTCAGLDSVLQVAAEWTTIEE